MNRNYEGAANLQLLLFTQNFLYLEVLCVWFIVSSPQIFCLMHESN